MSKAGKQIIRAAEEALEFSKGRKRLRVHSFTVGKDGSVTKTGDLRMTLPELAAFPKLKQRLN